MKDFASGPLIITGNTNPSQNYESDQGPSVFFQGKALYDPRYAGMIGAQPESAGVYGVRGFFASPFICLLDAQPQTLATAGIAALQLPTAATPMTLVNAAGAGIAINIPIVPMSSGKPQPVLAANLATPRVTLDFGFSTYTCVINQQLITIPAGNARFFYAGQKLLLSSALTATAPQVVTVATTPALTATTVAINETIARTVATNGQVGSADPTGIAASPYRKAGASMLFDPHQGVTRAVSVTSGNGASVANNVTVTGYDMWGNLQTEVIAFAGGAVTTNGKKAFKSIVSCVPDTTDAVGGHTISIGTTDIIGFNMAVDYWEHLDVLTAGLAVVGASTGFVAANRTSPNANNADPRGTYALQTASDGTRRTIIFFQPPVCEVLASTNLDSTAIFGVLPT